MGTTLMALPLLLLWGRLTAATWCVARSDATREALQTALDYACSAGADCAPLQQQSGLCFLPNTIQAHASYAFNSYYMRKFMAPGSCDFSGTANIAKTDPSYGSCIYPPTPSTAGGTTGGTQPPPPFTAGGGGGGGPMPIGNGTLDVPPLSRAFRAPPLLEITILFILTIFST